ncbi:hypothetical protein [Methanonatronarchaeum sp. AMET6-2]|uniref:hypothetical protein n=1 Tax=Methanonatronarchaeum sp. AMET6-2 TaxID=2933293 RepID=UPI0011FCE987|nr:hypothetical protein [Methanonatronarchaeum sp. AMET6-2]RZN60712.1 MAG: hypothetical protein EF811_06170 [Methanonatronarchaeia archaeon]UOY09894.1 hypothetical protein MU439_06445 [Methanonatronarchaeum sp. AMET6-2]
MHTKSMKKVGSLLVGLTAIILGFVISQTILLTGSTTIAITALTTSIIIGITAITYGIPCICQKNCKFLCKH